MTVYEKQILICLLMLLLLNLMTWRFWLTPKKYDLFIKDRRKKLKERIKWLPKWIISDLYPSKNSFTGIVLTVMIAFFHLILILIIIKSAVDFLHT
jgi:hypothetical protein